MVSSKVLLYETKVDERMSMMTMLMISMMMVVMMSMSMMIVK